MSWNSLGSKLSGSSLPAAPFADPLDPLVVFWVRRVAEDGQQLLVSPWSAAVLRWAGSPAVGAGGHGHARCERDRLLDGDLVFPPVAEVVAVFERVADVHDVVEHGAVCVLHRRPEVPVGVGNPVALAVDLELVEVVVPPTERGLDVLVQPVERRRRVHHDPTPHGWLDAEQRHLQLEQVRLVSGATHGGRSSPNRELDHVRRSGSQERGEFAIG